MMSWLRHLSEKNQRILGHLSPSNGVYKVANELNLRGTDLALLYTEHRENYLASSRTCIPLFGQDPRYQRLAQCQKFTQAMLMDSAKANSEKQECTILLSQRMKVQRLSAVQCQVKERTHTSKSRTRTGMTC